MFIAVGCVAAAVHLAMAFALVQYGDMRPALANIPAFACAFLVSFTGHSRHTFQTDAPPGWWRWLQVSVAGFLLNQGLYMLALRLFPQVWYVLLLASVTALVAFASYHLGRVWAFST